MTSTVLRPDCPVCKKAAIEDFHFFVKKTKEGKVYREKIVQLKCSHVIRESGIEQLSYDDIISASGYTLLPFQKEVCLQSTKQNFRVLLNLQMGLGKTICTFAMIKKYWKQLSPVVIICRAGLVTQMAMEWLEWMDGKPIQIINSGKDRPEPKYFRAFVISMDLLRNLKWLDELQFNTLVIDEVQNIKNPEASRTKCVRKLATGERIRTKVDDTNLIKRNRIKVIAEDLMKYHEVWGRFTLHFKELPEDKLSLCRCQASKDGRIVGEIVLSRRHAENDPEDEVVESILHEIAHAITPGAGHKPIWAETYRALGGNGQQFAYCEGTVDLQKEIPAPRYIIGLSGTPIKNHFGEYFTILNILDPRNFRHQSEFYNTYVDYYYTDSGFLKAGGIQRHSYENFKRITDPYIIRRTREEVLPDLPKIWRKFQFCNLNKTTADAYKKELGVYKDAYNDSLGTEGQERFHAKTEINNSLMRMRQIVGLAKIDPTVEFVTDFLDQRNGDKIVIFIHHIDVGTILVQKLDQLLAEKELAPTLRIEGGMKSDASYAIEQEFKTNPKRRVLVASTLAAGEGKNFQFCSDAIMMERQWNPPNEEQAEARFTRIGSIADKVNVTYIVAYGTVDEIFAKLVEKKRTILKQVHDGVWTDAMQSEIMQQLHDILASEGMTMFKM